MKKCVTEVMKLIRSLDLKKNLLQRKIMQESTVSYVESEEVAENQFDLAALLSEIDQIDAQMLSLKSKVQVSNCTTIVYENYTMQECLVLLAELSSKKSLLYDLAEKRELSRRNIQGTIEYTKTLYSTAQAKEIYDATAEKIMTLQMKMDLSNLTTMLEV